MPRSNPIKTTEVYQINCKFANFVLIPKNGISPSFFNKDPKVTARFETSDKIVCDWEAVAVYDNSDERYSDELDFFCQGHWSMSFDAVKSIWIGRLGCADSYWYILKLKL